MRIGAHFGWLGVSPGRAFDMSKSIENVFEQCRFPPHRAGVRLPISC